jgi:hypothetical protein
MAVLTEAQKQNFKMIRVNLYSNPGMTTIVSARYLPSIGSVPINNIEVLQHTFIAMELLSSGTYYAKGGNME